MLSDKQKMDPYLQQQLSQIEQTITMQDLCPIILCDDHHINDHWKTTTLKLLTQACIPNHWIVSMDLIQNNSVSITCMNPFVNNIVFRRLCHHIQFFPYFQLIH